jgi:hypothetical protein
MDSIVKDWKSVDWSRRTKDLAAELGTSLDIVSKARSVYAPDTVTGNIPNSSVFSKMDWSRIDWKKRNKDIAIATGAPSQYVGAKRRKVAPETVRRRKKIDPASIDWNKPFKVLCRETGLSYGQLKYLRDKTGKILSVLGESKLKEVDWRLDDATISSRFRVSVKGVRQARKKWGRSYQQDSSATFTLDEYRELTRILKRLASFNCTCQKNRIESEMNWHDGSCLIGQAQHFVKIL